jgi:hypothetical protein
MAANHSDTTIVPHVPASCNSDVLKALAPHARFYPVNPDKTPACRKLIREATTDLRAVHLWEQRHAGIGARINPGGRLFVLDLESPYKHAGRFGPDGMMTLCSLLDERDITLPPAPTTQTCTGGYHLYLLAPDGATVEPRVGAWPGVDILAGQSNVILPGSTLRAGTYTLLRGFERIPEAPGAFVDMLESTPRKQARPAPKIAVPTDGPGYVNNRQWFMLWRNKVFRTMWRGQKVIGDTSDSAYEYHLAKACFCTGLKVEQVVTVIRCWWAERGLRDRERKLRKAIIPAAWAEVAEYVSQFRITTPRESRGRPVSAVTRKVLEAATAHPDWLPGQIAAELGIRAHAVSVVLSRYRPAVQTSTIPGIAEVQPASHS